MKILVFSDTHGFPNLMLNVINQHLDASAIFFLGDGLTDADIVEEVYPKIPLYRVQGNCDFSSFAPEEGLTPLGGVLFFYTHGHRYNVKYGTDQLIYAAKRSGADVALFGHTHTPLYEKQDGIFLFNPGSLRYPRCSGPTYGLIWAQNGEASFQICPYQP